MNTVEMIYKYHI